jgi:hypothetical protein
MPVAQPHRTPEELARLGSEIFDRQVRPALRADDAGKFVAIDVETGDYEMDADDYATVARLRSRKPVADIWLMCAGYPTTYRMGRDDDMVSSRLRTDASSGKTPSET